ncbi:cation:proton antiporter domain-containing protein [Lignipirellula cremea]|uniref:Ammonium/H(+) antiporter subunit AmhT n=1 Tax=Lignipirellula cremea TaxID=2528010 RepID=A0A518E4P6_9BACT|nr:cation:proton antiporter [Lignipirellula cremea]QDU99057.1 Ammonium/H(+) antiporter subunit AmhT [Lignipirellula cremea]
MNHPDWYLALTVGLLLGAALIAGLVAQKLHLPRVTAYLLVGLALGPHTPLLALLEWLAAQVGYTVSLAGNHIPEEHLHYLEPVGKFAIALVLFKMGCHFPLTRFRRIVKRMLPISLGELGATMFLVTAGMGLLAWLDPSNSLTWQTVVLFGALALATAPATTVLVLEESRSEGPLTEFTTGLVAMNNLASIIVFEALFVIVHATRGAEISIGLEYLELTYNLALATLLGVLAGLTVSFLCGILPATRWLVLLTTVIAPLMAVCELLPVPYLLTFLAMGATVASTSDVADEISETLERLTGLMCVVFFVIHGAAMDLGRLWDVGLVGVSYIALRCLGKYFGVFFTTNAHRDGPQVKKWLGSALLSQAGAAIALSAIAVNRDEELGLQLQTIILGTVVFFEIVGPILVRTAVLQAGEVPVADAIFHTTSSPLEQLRNMTFRMLQACGVNPLQGSPADALDVNRVTRRNVKALLASARFDAVLDHIEGSHDNTYPVVNDNNELIGIIRYGDVRDVIFESNLKELVTAEDLAVPVKKVLSQNDTLGEAWSLLKEGRADCVPVVTVASPHQYVGVVRRRDLLRLLSHDGSRDQPRPRASGH